MKLAVFRAEADGRRTAARLAALGHEFVLAPVIVILPTGATVSTGDTDVVIFTSQHAAAALQTNDVRSLSTRPCFCVGAQTARAAAAIGFSDVRTTNGDAAMLAAAVGRAVSPSARIAFLAGRDRKPTVERTLIASGLTVRVTEVYAAEPSARWTAMTVASLKSCTGAVHYSRRSVALAFDRARESGLVARFAAWEHFCLSAEIAGALQDIGASHIRLAPTPDQPALLALLRSAAQPDA